MSWTGHLIILPIVLPMLAGAAMLFIDERQAARKAAISLATIVALIATATTLLIIANTRPPGISQVYRLADWPAPFAIVLVNDRLSAIFLLLTSVLALAAATYSIARWQKAGSHFQSLFQFLLMGLNGAFLTGDLFNLFVFFELLLAASYGLALHGSGRTRVRAGLHYIAVNLVASLFFLIGVSLIYAITGTLNMADIATRIPLVPPENRGMMGTGVAILGVAFLIKAGVWPLNFWLPPAYSAASPPVAAIFAIMTKVGVYVILRLWLLSFGPGTGASVQFGADWLLFGGMATMIFGAIGMLGAQTGSRLTGFAVLISSGTVLAVIASGQPDALAPALFYLTSSTLALGALFMLVELIDRGRDPVADMLAVTREAFGDEDEDEEDESEVGVIIPATMAFLGFSFICCTLMIAGLPPLSGFVGKFAILSALLDRTPDGVDITPWTTIALFALIVVTGLFALIAMLRIGIRSLWVPENVVTPQVRVVEMAPVVGLLVITVAMTVMANPVMRYMQATAGEAQDRREYIHRVLPDARLVVPPATGGIR